MSEYKPCPICKKADNIHMFRMRDSYSGHYTYYVACGRFKCRLLAVFSRNLRAYYGDSEEKATECWDRYAESLGWKRLD